ncbi:glutamate synthase [NADPH] large chain [Oceanobacillus oncorhynchi subsp. incaldanensis]|uniref:glutamate synthase large subunit n=1 Tax=Oceanobacillus oncorhynchi TaxID=545501 RepID=UPI001B2D96DB|nr:glutamate synthase large subunit [Oceanobacillus oncorhynchi]UUI38177.1 glutamate synthase large subunit [Oceanobacillus oncorhynchi]GIO17113.1 glutamate synthase [NADPH] large chain [Oceanobacillus oncorhynchi subsp. incaldanensis]
MIFQDLPKAQGLYQPDFEHDACGIGLYAHIKGKQTHDTVTKGLDMLCKLEHRGGQGSDPMTGDGSGLMVQIPDQYFRRVCPEFQLPSAGEYAVGMIFLSQDKQEQTAVINQVNQLIAGERQQLIGWRDVPVDTACIGKGAVETLPEVKQVFIRSTMASDEMAFERKLYVIRKQAEHWAEEKNIRFYVPSLSARTIVYKGLLTPEQVNGFYLDLQETDFVSAFSLVHSRFSTNTFPSWERAHPNRYLIHNGEINTLRGNVNWMRAREKQFVSDAFGDDLEKLLPIIRSDGSDSATLDNALEFLTLAGREPAHAAMMLIPEPWDKNSHMNQERRAFYQYHSLMMEPWDGPTSITFTNGKQIGAILDRNGLRPARYYVTKDDYIIYSSEVGVVDVEESNVLLKERLSPGKMLLIDIEKGRIISDEEIKSAITTEYPYQDWVKEQTDVLAPEVDESTEMDPQLYHKQKAFGYTMEDIEKYLIPLVQDGKDPIGAMGNDAPLAVLSERPQSLFNYFKQLFAQVTNPPIDAYREQLVTSMLTWLGSEGDMLHPETEKKRRIRLDSPILSNVQMEKIENNEIDGLKAEVIEALFTDDLEAALKQVFEQAKAAIYKGKNILVLRDTEMNQMQKAIPALLAVSGLHQFLIREGIRTKASILIQSGEAREVHHFAAMLGYGVDAIYPYLVYQTYHQAFDTGKLALNPKEAQAKYIAVATEGIIKVMSKIGISTVQSYRGAQIFEAVGISKQVIEDYFTGTASQIDGIDLGVIQLETEKRHQEGYQEAFDQLLDSGSEFQWRKTGEHHAFNPSTIYKLQWSCRRGDYKLFKQFSKESNEARIGFLRNLFDFKKTNSISIDEVESVDTIVKRFKTGAMSFGSISKEAHETLAIAMNRLGGKSNSGEGGEDTARFTPDANGDLRSSAIKQVASGRFGVTSNYLINAKELQIKVAQGAKPGEGGQLPAEKVYPWVADVRRSTPGVDLISPPPHHDIYSIEDLAQLIHDLKNANSNARVSVKLVAKSGVGTIAAGVAKGNADVISVVGYDGGTGASPKTSIKHTGLPWELGLAEAHQTLMLNGLRDRVILETDGKLLTGKDVVTAALLGAEEYGFATAPLVVVGCVMMRVCHKDTCPVGVATQNPELRKKFAGDPDHVVNYMRFIAEEVREIMAELGFRTMDEMIGRTEYLERSARADGHWKAKHLDLSTLVYQVEGTKRNTTQQDHKLDQSLDIKEILPAVQESLETGEAMEDSFSIKNTDRVAGTIVGSEITAKYGEEGLPEDTINLHFTGSAGQSFGAFIPAGMTMTVTGDANDYVGKGLSGGKVIVRAPEETTIDASHNVIAGNVSFYGATSGEAYIHGYAGERFAVRNSGAKIVVEGVGDHGCEYMTGGKVVILGNVGKNFAAGMSGGIVYVRPDDVPAFRALTNAALIQFEEITDLEEQEEVKDLIINHLDYTNSEKAAFILKHWKEEVKKFVKVIPTDYKLMLQQIQWFKEQGLGTEDARYEAFMAKKNNEMTVKLDEESLMKEEKGARVNG